MLIEDSEKSKFIPELIIEYLWENGIKFITSLPKNSNSTIDDVINYCERIGEQEGKFHIDFESLIRKAVSLGYDKRYFVNSKDERKSSIAEFCDTFFSMLEQIGIRETYRQQNVIVVGVGNGSECEMLYSDIENISIVDIAPNSLNRAQNILPQAKSYLEMADKLESISNSSFDLYISLRTYQSTYFNISASLKEAKRILKKNGAIIISILKSR